MIPDIMGGVFRKVGMPATAFVTPYVFFNIAMMFYRRPAN